MSMMWNIWYVLQSKGLLDIVFDFLKRANIQGHIKIIENYLRPMMSYAYLPILVV